MTSIEEAKARAGKIVAGWAMNDEVIGLGSGSTALATIRALAARVREEGLKIFDVATSYETVDAAVEAGIELVSPWQHRIDWAFDGADEIDPCLNLIKGRGGEFFKEKIVASLAQGLTIVVDDSKLVERLGHHHPVPVEVIPFARELVIARLRTFEAVEIKVRMAMNRSGFVITEQGNLILDSWFQKIEPDYELRINAIPGVVANGLFFGMAQQALIASATQCYLLKTDGTRHSL